MSGTRPVALVVAALVVATVAVVAPVAGAADDPVCAPLKSVIEEAPRGWRNLKTDEYSTQFESWQSRQTLPGYESCWIDDVSHRFWCLNRAPGAEAAGKAADAQAGVIDRCWPGVPTLQSIETGDNNITRVIRDWTLPADRRLRLVHRKPTRGSGLSSVFLYVY